MRPAYIGFALVWIFSTTVIGPGLRLMANAPVFVLILLVPPALVLYYGLTATEGAQKRAPDPQYLPPVTGTVPVPRAVLHQPVALPDGVRAPDPQNLLPSTSTSPDPLAVVQVAALPSFSLKRAGLMMAGAARYALAAFFCSGKRFVLLILATLLFAIPLAGYLVRVLRGADPAPEVRDWAGLAADGIRVPLIVILYAIPTVVVAILLGLLNGLVFAIVLIAAVLYLLPAALFSFARNGSLPAAFGIGSVFDVILKIGWLPYTGFCILCLILNTGFSFLYLVPYAGTVLMALLVVPLVLFEARYLALLYENGEGPENDGEYPVDI